jgi:hypothetical protein
MKTISIALALTLLFAFGCRNEPAAPATTEPTAAAANLTPEQLGELGAKIRKQPNDAQRLLTEAGLTEESFEQAIRKVSEDPQASKRYAAAFNRANA